MPITLRPIRHTHRKVKRGTPLTEQGWASDRRKSAVSVEHVVSAQVILLFGGVLVLERIFAGWAERPQS